jgi:predicted metalloprotease
VYPHRWQPQLLQQEPAGVKLDGDLVAGLVDTTMKWREARTSDNVEDRRGRRMGTVPMGGMGLGGLLLLLFVGYLVGGDPLTLLDQVASIDPGTSMAGDAPPPNDEGALFVRKTLGDLEDTWDAIFRERGQTYPHPTLVLFTDAVQSACGMSSAAVGPFYCPGDEKVYIDLSFYRDLSQRFGAPGDFAQAYVIAHEVGHHVQNVLGVFDAVRRQSRDRASASALSVRQELQADCFAGVWGYYAAQRGLLEPGDVEEGLSAAAAIGDDRIQQQTQGRVTPETWTHGSSAQRVAWLRRGLESGRVEVCDTFAR